MPRDREGWRAKKNRKKGPKESGAGVKLGLVPAPDTPFAHMHSITQVTNQHTLHRTDLAKYLS